MSYRGAKDRAFARNPAARAAHGRIVLPGSSYYVMAAAISAAFFFLMWDILNDGRNETPWVPAGIGASVLLCCAVIIREVNLRRSRTWVLRQQRVSRLGADAGGRPGDERDANKLTIERNAAILADIKRKSGAAKVLDKFSAGHKEVFELCREYLERNEAELALVNAGSPRLAPLLRGRTTAVDDHRYHLLRWAEIEARSLTGEANRITDTAGRIDAGLAALSVIDSALESYPSEPALLESREVLVDLVASIKVGDCVERAERAEFDGNRAESVALYKEALYFLGRENAGGIHRDEAAVRIRAAIDRLTGPESGD
ncbi:MAG TPA: hypothetical protein VNA17_01430 [Pyrinomonadaceae bacterium]|nr:hypothetical protein [Pyrinomonadaceae bacterium]